MEAECSSSVDSTVDFPPLTPHWSPPPDKLPSWGPPQSPWSVGPMKGKTREECYTAISRYLMSEEELHTHGFPYFVNNNSMINIDHTKYYRDNPLFMSPGTHHRKCCRCDALYLVGPAPFFANPRVTCLSHSRPSFDPEKREVMHPCCKKPPDTVGPGCMRRNFHVFHHIFATEIFKFVECPPSEGEEDVRRNSVYALDCEMVYTSYGPALARLSLVDIFGKVVMDVLVKPEGEVYDANTMYSGLTKKQVKRASDTLDTCRAKLFRHVSRDSILIGHSLEADLRALRLVHKRIVDTSVLFMDGNRKKGLRVLASEFLKRDIQSTKGHDSTEDAKTCIELLAFQLDLNETDEVFY